MSLFRMHISKLLSQHWRVLKAIKAWTPLQGSFISPFKLSQQFLWKPELGIIAVEEYLIKESHGKSKTQGTRKLQACGEQIQKPKDTLFLNNFYLFQGSKITNSTISTIILPTKERIYSLGVVESMVDCLFIMQETIPSTAY